MHLTGDHKVNLTWFYVKAFEIYGMRATAISKQYQVIKRVTVREEKVFVGIQVRRKPANQDLILLYIIGKCANINCWNAL